MSLPLFEIPPAPGLPVRGEDRAFPVGRIFCVGRNYAAHAAEMGVEVDREAPFYFTKTPSAAVLSSARIPYPLGTANYHHEMELAVMIGASALRIPAAEALGVVLGYACALDMTRRDLQNIAKERRRPWDLGKDFENSAVFAPITRAEDFGDVAGKRIHLAVNGDTRQDATLDEMIHGVPEVIADLSQYYHLRAGDIILTGTPAGVGAVVAGDHLTGGIDGLDPIELIIGERD